MLELNTVFCGNNLDLLKQLDDKSIQCCVTSPPYFGLRNYGVDGQIGLENTLQEYISNLVKVFSEVHRVLRDDGTLWLNLGDSYMSAHGIPPEQTVNNGGARMQITEIPGNRKPQTNLKQKDLMGIPWRVAFALQDWGWYLRSDIIWAKGISFNSKYSGSCMPESCKDRPTKSHEYLFLLTKSPKYYYDNYGVKESAEPASAKRYEKPFHVGEKAITGQYSANGQCHTPGIKPFDGKRNLRSVWTINPKPFRGAHFATMPPKLIEPCIKAGTSEFGCCKDCGKPYKRIIEKGCADESHKALCGADSNGEYLGEATKDYEKSGAQNASEVKARILAGMVEIKTIGWKKDCKCLTDEIKPCITLDPFFGAGSVGLVAKQLGRDWMGFDLNESYCNIACDRIQEILL